MSVIASPPAKGENWIAEYTERCRTAKIPDEIDGNKTRSWGDFMELIEATEPFKGPVSVATLKANFPTLPDEKLTEIVQRYWRKKPEFVKYFREHGIEPADPAWWDAQPPAGLRPEVRVDHDEWRVNAEAVAALANLPDVYQRGQRLVRIVRGASPPQGISRDDSSLTIAEMPAEIVRERLSEAAEFFIESSAEDGPERKRIDVPTKTAKAIFYRGEYKGIPAIEAVVETPVLRRDGSVLQQPGFDRETGLYYSPQTDFPAIADRPTKDDAVAARELILDAVCDFPFATGEDRAAWLAAALTPTARFCFEGPSPMFVIDANAPGSGKSLLADTIGMIHSGQKLARTAATPCDEEMRKKITSLLLIGERIALFDNIVGPLGCSSLDAYLTSDFWHDRILGKSQMTARLPATTIFLASGNNVQFASDIPRRVLRIRIETQVERPEDRTGFTHPNLLTWARCHRGPLAAAAVTLLRAYLVAGQPQQVSAAWGSFVGWSNLIRNAVVWAGLPDPGETRLRVAEESDRSRQVLALLIAGWEQANRDGTGLRASDAIELLRRPVRQEESDPFSDLRAAITELSPAGKEISAPSLGKKLLQYKGRVVGEKYFSAEPDPHTKVNRWIVRGVRVIAGDVLCGKVFKEVNQLERVGDRETDGPKQPPQPTAPPASRSHGLRHCGLCRKKTEAKNNCRGLECSECGNFLGQ